MNTTPKYVAATPNLNSSAELLSPFQIRDVKLENRIVVSPMCQFCGKDGFPNEWHLIHLASRAIGGAGMVFVEATAVAREGRITPGDLGLWDDAHIAPMQEIAQAITRYGSVPAIQLAHAGRKSSRYEPWNGSHPLPDGEAWRIIAPSAVTFDEKGALVPEEMTLQEIDDLVTAFEKAAKRAVDAGFKVIELHGAHGYLLHQFLSPVSNRRNDAYGGTLEGRMRLVLRIVERVRAAIPDGMPLFARISATDWIEDEPSWDVPQSVELAKRLKALGVDLIDVSSGGLSLSQKITIGPNYQVGFAHQVRHEANVMTSAVGLITEPEQADQVLREGNADLVFIGRAFLRNPYWGLGAQEKLKGEASWPKQYGRHALRRR